MKKILFAVVVYMAAVGSYQPAFAQADEPTVYVIKKGDTLWGLSDKFLKDPYYWPNLWANNDPSITNPHLIFPGQKVRIYPDRIELQPAPAIAGKPEVPAAKPPAEEVVPEKTFLVRGGTGFLLEKEISHSGYIISTYQNREIVGEDDVVYTDIGKLQGGKVGDRFSIFQKMGAVSHPVTNLIMGYKVVPLGALQLSEVEEKASKAIVTKSFIEIGRGAYLMPYRDRRREVALKAATREVSGYIIETQTGNRAVSSGDVVFLDLGSEKGVEVGNLLYVIREMVPDQLYVHGTVDKLPDEVLGALVVVETGEKTSTGLIIKSIDTVYLGDRVDLKKSK